MKITTLFATVAISFTSAAFAIDKTSTAPRVRIGNIETTSATIDQVLSFPNLVVLNPTCVVTSYKLTISSGSHKYGPFINKDPQLTAEQKTILTGFKQQADAKLFIEDIHVNCGGLDELANTISLTCTK